MDKNLGLFAKQAAEQIGTNPHTLRRWAIELEKEGYVFSRNNKGKDGHRIFYEPDIQALTIFRDLISQLQDYEQVAKLTVARVGEGVIDKLTSIVNEENDLEQPVTVTFTEQELKQYTERIIEETSKRVASETANAVYNRMENLLENRDRELLTKMNESMEQRRLEVAAAREQNSAGFWGRIFGRK
ncbi:hypothetical protein [Priestia megaterium]